MVDLKPDVAAEDIIRSDTEGEGVVMFKGWLGPIEGGAVSTPADGADEAGASVDVEHVRFFTDPQFLDWLEIPVKEIFHRTSASADDPEGGSVIWVRREARIRRCEYGRAYWFHHQKVETADDPTARWPRPPH
jgi:hypothetical protein